MSRWLLYKSENQIIVKVIRLGKVVVIIYGYNLGRVRKSTYKMEKNDIDNYLAKNRDELLEKNRAALLKSNGGVKIG